ncbi:hypothetical protein EVAR_52876_1 [Eumeta japonica]|uniref:Uncharacterized protein n=1 Tax=Eumeta variegata TaxID=151549 RepID=A0A4C1YP59_EUMVA|nr:hypothetical protein EVAR_52876_1 [Eumeta japonica]
MCKCKSFDNFSQQRTVALLESMCRKVEPPECEGTTRPPTAAPRSGGRRRLLSNGYPHSKHFLVSYSPPQVADNSPKQSYGQDTNPYNSIRQLSSPSKQTGQTDAVRLDGDMTNSCNNSLTRHQLTKRASMVSIHHCWTAGVCDTCLGIFTIFVIS